MEYDQISLRSPKYLFEMLRQEIIRGKLNLSNALCGEFCLNSVSYLRTPKVGGFVFCDL